VKQNGEVTFFFLRDKRKFPVACVAYHYDEKEQKIKFGVSTHNPIDQYDRKVGRAFAASRILLEPNYETAYGDIKWKIIATISMGPEGKPSIFPTRTKQAATTWLTEFQKRTLAERRKVA
jgi:hypothetical protein